MDEFLKLVDNSHRNDLKVIMDFVPNHVARQYKSIAKGKGVRDLGEDDDKTKAFDANNNFYYCVNTPFSPNIDLYGGEAKPYSEFPAKATGNDQFCASPSCNDWYETVKLNYGVDYCDAGGRSEHFDPIPNTWHKMLDILLYWASKGVDGFRRYGRNGFYCLLALGYRASQESSSCNDIHCRGLQSMGVCTM